MVTICHVSKNSINFSLTVDFGPDLNNTDFMLEVLPQSCSEILLTEISDQEKNMFVSTDRYTESFSNMKNGLQVVISLKLLTALLLPVSTCVAVGSNFSLLKKIT